MGQGAHGLVYPPIVYRTDTIFGAVDCQWPKMIITGYGKKGSFHWEYFLRNFACFIKIFVFNDVIDIFKYYVIKSLTLLFPPT